MLSKYANKTISVQVKSTGNSAKEYLYFTEADLTVSQRITESGRTEYLQSILELPDSFNINDDLAKEITYISLVGQIACYQGSSNFPYKRFVSMSTVCKSGGFTKWGKYSNLVLGSPTTDNKNYYMYQDGGSQIYSYILNDSPSSSSSLLTSSSIGITKQNQIYFNIFFSEEENYKPSILINGSDRTKIYTKVYIAF